jgi:hypothetical protein
MSSSYAYIPVLGWRNWVGMKQCGLVSGRKLWTRLHPLSENIKFDCRPVRVEKKRGIG